MLIIKPYVLMKKKLESKQQNIMWNDKKESGDLMAEKVSNIILIQENSSMQMKRKVKVEIIK